MKTPTAIVALALATATAFAAAQQNTPSQPGAKEKTQPAIAGPAAEPDAAVTEQELEALQAQLDELKKTKDPTERRHLMRTYRQKMAGKMANRGRDGSGMMMGSMPMGEHMQAMQQRMQQMMATDNPEKQSELMDTQHRQMHAMMAMMQRRHAGGRGMMSDDSESGGRRGGMHGSHGTQQEWMAAAFRQLEKRLDMIQERLDYD